MMNQTVICFIILHSSFYLRCRPLCICEPAGWCGVLQR